MRWVSGPLTGLDRRVSVVEGDELLLEEPLPDLPSMANRMCPEPMRCFAMATDERPSVGRLIAAGARADLGRPFRRRVVGRKGWTAWGWPFAQCRQLVVPLMCRDWRFADTVRSR